MLWWVLGGVVGVAVLVLAGAALSLGRRLAALRRAGTRARQRAAQAAALQSAAEGVRARLAAVQTRAAATRPARPR